MAFISCNNGDLSKTFITEAEIIDRFVGNQLWLWGNNSPGTLGDNSTINKSTPVQTVSQGNNWEQTASGDGYNATIKTDGTLWLWGTNIRGQLGNNAGTPVSSPVQTVSTGTNWKQVSLGCYTTAAIKTDGTLWLWGEYSQGELGTNSTALSQQSPVQTITQGNNWKQVSNSGGSSVAAIKTDGTL